jgi:hypothetical protein
MRVLIALLAHRDDRPRSLVKTAKALLLTDFCSPRGPEPLTSCAIVRPPPAGQPMSCAPRPRHTSFYDSGVPLRSSDFDVVELEVSTGGASDRHSLFADQSLSVTAQWRAHP